jgi:hypothetical protein
VFLLAAPVAALAVAVKYGAVLWVPTIAVLPILTAWPDRIKRVWLYPIGFLAVVGELVFVGLQLGGHVYATAAKTTTTDPAHGTISLATVLSDSLKWGGVLFALAVFGSIAYVWRVSTQSGEQIAPAGGPDLDGHRPAGTRLPGLSALGCLPWDLHRLRVVFRGADGGFWASPDHGRLLPLAANRYRDL